MFYNRKIAASGAKILYVAAPSPIIACARKQVLIRPFFRAVSDYHRVQTAQLAALRNGEDFLFEDELAAAAIRRENAKYAVLAHADKHGC